MAIMHITHQYRQGPTSLEMKLRCCTELLEIKVNVTVQKALYLVDIKPVKADLFPITMSQVGSSLLDQVLFYS